MISKNKIYLNKVSIKKEESTEEKSKLKKN